MKEVNVTLSEEDFKKILKKIVVHPNSKLIVDAIVGNLTQTSHGCSHLYKAFMGIEATAKFKVGDTVWIEENALPTWRMNIEKMKADGKFFQGKLAGRIDKVDIYSSDVYTVDFNIINPAGLETIDFYPMRESYLSERDDDEIELM
jgi:hypothetical protein